MLEALQEDRLQRWLIMDIHSSGPVSRGQWLAKSTMESRPAVRPMCAECYPKIMRVLLPSNSN
eukprot:42902-Eustigmatos_ZCMA.PRE.1